MRLAVGVAQLPNEPNGGALVSERGKKKDTAAEHGKRRQPGVRCKGRDQVDHDGGRADDESKPTYSRMPMRSTSFSGDGDALNYISLESALSDAGVISQIPINRVTLMSSGRTATISCGQLGSLASCPQAWLPRPRHEMRIGTG